MRLPWCDHLPSAWTIGKRSRRVTFQMVEQVQGRRVEMDECGVAAGDVVIDGTLAVCLPRTFPSRRESHDDRDHAVLSCCRAPAPGARL